MFGISNAARRISKSEQAVWSTLSPSLSLQFLQRKSAFNFPLNAAGITCSSVILFGKTGGS
jgi:hypothetical protein